MQIEFIYHTPDYHKLVESLARNCYQSYSKVSETSHTMIRAIMAKGHLSIASVGNMVFGVKFTKTSDYESLLEDLTSFKEINNFIRWSFPSQKNSNSNYNCVFSLNILTLLDLYKEYPNMYTDNSLLNPIMEFIKDIPYLNWFFDNSVEVPTSDNPYMVTPIIGNPIILTEDYNSLKDILTPYELDMHATVTVDMVTDRAIGLQMWRHGDMTGGTELSQRYVDRSNAKYRIPKELQESKLHRDYRYIMDDHIADYIEFQQDLLNNLEISKMRAKEIARNLLPCVETRILQCRPLRQWKHFFDLRCTPHAQPEMQLDAYALRDAFEAKGIKVFDKVI